jgi:hypothetical protein
MMLASCVTMRQRMLMDVLSAGLDELAPDGSAELSVSVTLKSG